MFVLTKNPVTGFNTAFVVDDKIIGQLVNVHSETACAAYGCAIHDHPTDHPLKDSTLIWREPAGILHRVCQHGVLHPDADSALYLERVGQSYKNIHTCDGCC